MMRSLTLVLGIFFGFASLAAPKPSEQALEALLEEETSERRWFALDIQYAFASYPRYLLATDSYVGAGGYKLAINFEVLLSERIGKFGVGVGGGFYLKPGYSYISDSITQSTSTANIFSIPIELFLSYRFDYWPTQWIVPFVKGGGEFQIGRVFATSSSGEATVASSTYAGYNLGGGLEINLNEIDADAARSLAVSSGIYGTYFTGEVLISGPLMAVGGMDLTRLEIRTGLRFEF